MNRLRRQALLLLSGLAFAAGCASDPTDSSRANISDPVRRQQVQARQSELKQQERNDLHEANPTGRRP